MDSIRLLDLPPGLSGLTDEQAAERRRACGPNVVTTSRATLLRTLVRQLASPFDALLLGVAVLSIILNQPTDATIVLTIVIASVALGTRNEYRAERIIEDLRARITRKATVIRSGEARRVDVDEIIVGDVVALAAGDAVPADIEIRQSRGLESDESMLTGESRPVEKQPGSRAYMGTMISAGRAYGIVVAVGSATHFGEIAAHAANHAPPTSFETGLGRFSLMLLVITAVLSVAVFLVSLLLQRPVVESLLFALAISVSLSPQMLPIIVSVSLSLGAYHMAKRGAIVQRLVAIEDVGNITVLFTDKTGTLTSGELAFETAVDAAGTPSENALFYGILCSNVGRGGDPSSPTNALDIALTQHVSNAMRERAATMQREDERPFNYEDRLMFVVVSIDGRSVVIAKGAPEAVLTRCADSPASANATLERYMDAGARVVAVAVRAFDAPVKLSDVATDALTFVGFLVFSDPPKADIGDALAQLRALDVEIKVITGDHPRAAQALCSRVGLTLGATLSGAELEALSDAELLARLKTTNLFARISPIQKERIIRVQRSAGDDVGFLGDGINDALALRIADVGISVDSAADIAKHASDVVLVTKDLALLAEGVREGRRIFTNTMKYVLMAVSSNFGNMFSASIGSMVLPFLPLLPSQVLLNNLLYDVSEMTIPSDRTDEEMLARPSHWNLPFVQRFMLAFGWLSSLGDFSIFAVLIFVAHAEPVLFRSAFFIESFLTQALVVFLLRTRHVPFFRSRPSAQLALTTILCAAIGVLLPFSPLAHVLGFQAVPLPILASIIAIVAGYVVAVELTKAIFFGVIARRSALRASFSTASS